MDGGWDPTSEWMCSLRCNSIPEVLIDHGYQSLERILYVWAIRHPASGYVQGINDLVTPFYQVFLSSYIGVRCPPPTTLSLTYRDIALTDCDPENFDPASLPPNVLTAIEADSFWCLSRLLDGIQDNYISQQPGIQRSVKRMQDLVGRIDGAYVVLRPTGDGLISIRRSSYGFLKPLSRHTCKLKASSLCNSPLDG